MKLVLMADSEVGIKIAEFLSVNYPEDIALVVTTKKNEIYYAAKESGVPVSIFESEEGLLAELQCEVDLGVMAWWPEILKLPLLDLPKYGFINTHPSFLPHNRGKHYNFWALIEQVPFGVTLHRVNSGVDSGDIVAQTEIEYDWCDNGGTLYFKAQEEMVKLFCKTYPRLRSGNFEGTPQDSQIGSFHHSSEIDRASKISLDATYSARELLNMLRARTFEGHPGCWFEEAGDRYEVSISIRKIS